MGLHRHVWQKTSCFIGNKHLNHVLRCKYQSKIHADSIKWLNGERSVSTWQIAAGGLQRKLRGIKQRTAWRFRTLKDKNATIVFSVEDDSEKEISIQPRNRHLNDPMACHNVLERVPSYLLNGILSATSPEESSQFCTTMTGFILHSCSPMIRSNVLDVLTKKRLEEISITNRAVIIRAIQRCLLSPLHREKAVLYTAACNVLRGTYGRELSILKEQINAKYEQAIEQQVLENASLEEENKKKHQEQEELEQLPNIAPHSGDLSQLIYGNKNVTEVVQVMQHLAREGLIVQEEEKDLVKVVSDIDDTLFAGWIDRRYPLHCLYPGVSELYSCISRGLSDSTLLEDKSTADIPSSVTFLTARPRGWLSVGRYLTVQQLTSIGVPNATVLNGSMRGLMSSSKIAGLKFENFVRYATLFPEFKFVFFGDSGQGDALLASRLLEAFPSQVLATFIHDVNPDVPKTGDGAEKQFYKEQGIDFFQTYIGAALSSYEKKLINEKELQQVVHTFQRKFEEVPFPMTSKGQERKKMRQVEIEKDLYQVSQVLRQNI